MDQERPVKIIQISDIHLLEDHTGELLGVPTQKSFEAVVDLIKKNEEEIDMILLTGDLSQDCSEVTYKRLADMLKVFDVPIYWVPGNHDDSNVMNSVYPLLNVSNQKHIILKSWQLILLDSHIPEQVPGRLDETQLDYLKNCLQEYPQHDAIVVFHHHPVSVYSGWIDKIGVLNAEQFWQTISPFHNVHSVIYGHIHQENVQKIGNVNCYSVPSTCIQFKPHHDEFALDGLNPGYRWVHLYPNGRLETGVKRTKKYIGVFDEDAKGY